MESEQSKPLDIATRLVQWFQPRQNYVVALSGGVDSAVVARAGSLSNSIVIAATGVGPATSNQERCDAEQIVRLLGIDHYWIESGEHLSPDYQRNDLQRCFHCKSHLFAALVRQFPDHILVTGTNFDDLGDFRPGLEAAKQANVRAPLAELKISKDLVRKLAEHWQLPVADKPASPCLASRLAYGVEVTEGRLARVEAAEILIKRLLGIRDCRVRLHADELARIELPPEHLSQAICGGMLPTIASELTKLGFRFVTLDLAGQRSGSLNPEGQSRNSSENTLHQLVLPSNRG